MVADTVAAPVPVAFVPPEDLMFHVADAIHTAHASRIGHGVDIMHEIDSENTLAAMRENNIPLKSCLPVMTRYSMLAGQSISYRSI